MDQGTSEQKTRSFLWLNVTQFLGALNDNLFKLVLIFFLIDLQGFDDAGRISAFAGAVFVVPFLTFSPIAGVFADRIRKSKVIVATKVCEVLVMSVGATAIWFSSPLGLYVALFLMALQSAFFSPAKYGIVPEIVSREGLSKANGLIEAFTYLAIILGTIVAASMPLLPGDGYRTAGIISVAIALLGAATSTGIRERYPAAEQAGTVKAKGELRRSLSLIRHDRYLAMAVLGASLFMLVGAFVQLNLIPLGIQEFGLSQEQSGALFLLAAFGIGTGSLIAGRLSGRNVELGVVPIGALMLFVSAAVLGLAAGGLVTAFAAIALLGTGAGLFIVPLHSFIQFRSPQGHRGKVLAAVNFLGWSGVLAAAVLTHLINEVLALPAQAGFLWLGICLAVITILTFLILPDFLLRFVALVMMKLVYRVRIDGPEHVPVEGGALLVANHVSWVDALLLLATQQRRIRFLMEREIYNSPLLGYLFRLMGVIPISSEDGRKQLVTALKRARQAVDDGFLVCIFAEGALTRNGTLQEFRPGFEKIVRGSQHAVIPVHIGGIWGSIFTYKHGPLLSTFPKALPGPVTISFGRPMPSSSSSNQVRQAVMELSGRYFAARKDSTQTLAKRFIQSARNNWRRPAIADSMGKKLTYGQSLAGALMMRNALAEKLANQERVGVLLPPSVGGALANIALTLSGRVPVNLNYSVSSENLRSAVAQAGIETVLTSRKFLEKLGRDDLPGEPLCLEDVFSSPGFSEKIRSWLAARFLPASWILRQGPKNPDAVATIIFSSGSTSEPKGVMLSHHNILANIDALKMVFSVDRADNVCGILPFFHSFGFTGTLWFPLLAGFSATYHPTPLDAKRIVSTIRKHRSTFLLATPTFLSAYLRKAKQDDLQSLRVVISGAEKLSGKLAEDFRKKVGITPLEGYGATELSPVAAISLPDVELGNKKQIGSRPESVGRPLPGVAVRIVDPDSGQLRGTNESGMIEICGPNVMLGYLNQPDKTREVVKEGWYVTGDIGSLDEKGFLKISGRLSRFSKIAGEMVPHGAIEEIFEQALDSDETAVAVTAVADEKKGERIVVLFLPSTGGVGVLKAIMDKCHLPNLWKPTTDSYLQVETIPLLGSGKLDLRALRAMAEERFC